MAKGGQYERVVCKQLSAWWSGDPEVDDLFWRSSQSGGRATVRRRKGKSTRGHCGDICATDSTGEPFVKFITVEVKSGYNKSCVFDLFDKVGRHGKVYPDWFEQATAAGRNAGTPYWVLIHRRDHRDPIVVMPNSLLLKFKEVGCDFPIGLVLEEVSALRLADFFTCVDPQDIRVLLARSKR